jgi:nitroreductase
MRSGITVMIMLAVLFCFVTTSGAADVIQLPKPQTTGGKPLMQVIGERHSSRDFSSREIPSQVLSNLLWVAWGINRPEGKRTVPTANNKQGMDVYAVTAKGAYLYDAASNTLKQVTGNDVRALTGRQDFVGKAPLNLVYVSDYAKMGSISDQDKLRYAGAHTGFMGQNVYLYCASEGLVTVFRAWFDGPALTKELKLRPDQKVIFCQTVGYPK